MYLYNIWAYLMAQMVKNPPAMQETQETWVQSLGQEDSLEQEMATHSSSCLESSTDGGTWWGISSPYG